MSSVLTPYINLIAFFGSSTAKDKIKKAQEEIEKYKEEITKEQEEKLAAEKQAIDKELGELFSTTPEIDVQTALDMPSNYERFRFNVEINQFTVALSKGEPDLKSNKMVELSITEVKVAYKA